LFTRYRVGDRVTVHAFRRDELMTFDVTLQGDRVPCVQIAAVPGARKAAIKRPSAT
jgi:predicted metalloprotease with PDZ domain